MRGVARAREVWATLRVASSRPRASAELETALRDLAVAGLQTEEALPVDSIIFSRDRAMQLDASFRSIVRFAPYRGPIVVIYKATSQTFADGYGR